MERNGHKPPPLDGNVPILGQQKPRAGVGIVGVLIRDLDENGTYEPETVTQTPQGLVATAGRANIVTAEDLVEMIRVVVREEIAAALDKTTFAP